MTSAPERLSRVSIFALAAAALAVPAAAAQVDYFLKIEGVEGESTEAAHKDWIDIVSVNWGHQAGYEGGYAGGANVAAGDVNADRAAAAKKKKGNVETTWKVEKGEKARPAPGSPGSVKSPGSDPQTTGLLLPAIQKARGTMRGNYPACKVGEMRDKVIATGRDGQRYVLEDVTITACNRPAGSTSGDTVPTDSVSFNYGKIKSY